MKRFTQYKRLESYCLNRKNDTINKNSKIARTKHINLVIISKCTACDKKKATLIKTQESSGLLSYLGMKTPLSKIPWIGYILF